MSQIGFLYDGRGYSLNEVQWITKPGRCVAEDKECPLGYVIEKNKWKCENNLIGHSCKHVIKGNDNEKERYKEVMSKQGKDESIPESIQGKTDDVIENYKELSLDVLKESSSVSITGEGKNIRIVCDGAGLLDGLVVFLSIETPWSEDLASHCLIKEERRCKQLGIISSYFNLSSGDIYVMYRLVYQRYYEKKKQGYNVSPTIQRKWVDHSKVDILPEIDLAFDQAGLFYRKKTDGNYAFGAVFYFFWAKYVQTGLLGKMYDEMAPAFAEYSEPRQLVWDVPQNSDLSMALKTIKTYEHIYSARTIMEYIVSIAGPEFKPDMHILQEFWQGFLVGNMGALPFLTDYLNLQTGAVYEENVKKRYELVVQRRLLERFGNIIENSYTDDSLSQIADFIKENETEDGTVGSVADHASYTVAHNLTKYFVALYVFCHNFHESYKVDTSHCDYIRDQIKKWKGYREKCRSVLKGSLFNEWMRIFNDLFRIENKLAEIESYRKE